MTLPDKKIILSIIAILIVIAVAAIVLITRSQPQVSLTPTSTPSATPGQNVTISLQPESNILIASQSALFDVFLNTNGTHIDSFQFIITLDGTSKPHVLNSGTAKSSGNQILAQTIPGLSTVTNSSIEQAGKSTIRFAMITENSKQPYSTSNLTKIATILVNSEQAGTLQFNFDSQNTLATITGTSQDTPLVSTGFSGTVSPSIAPTVSPFATPAPATSSAKTTKTQTSKTLALSTPTPIPTTQPSIASSLDPTNGLDQTSASSSATPTPLPTTTPLPAIASPSATLVPVLSSSATSATNSALPSELPKTGGISDSIALLLSGTGFFFIGFALLLR